MRELTEYMDAEIARPITRPLNLIEILLPSVTLRWSTGRTVEWDGDTWTDAGVTLEALRALAGGAMEGMISVRNTELAASGLVLVDGVNDRPCRIWELSGPGPFDPADAVMTFEGVCDGTPDISIERVRIAITSASRVREMSPRIYFEQFCNHIPPAGTVISWGGEHYRLEARGGG